MPDILDLLDAAIAEADSTTADLCEQFFAEAMAGVRDAIDGSELERPFCDSLECEHWSDSGYDCTDTLARWRPTEADELVPLRPSSWSGQVPVGPIGNIRVRLHTAAEVESPSWTVVGMTTHDSAFTWSAGEALSPWDSFLPWAPQTMSFSFEPTEAVRCYFSDFSYGDARHFTIEDPVRTVAFQGGTVDLPRSVPDLVPPAREHAAILRWHHLLEPGALEMPKADWAAVGQRDAWLRGIGPVVTWNRRGKMVEVRG